MNRVAVAKELVKLARELVAEESVRVFYLGGLPRPNVGIAKKQIDEINEILNSHKSLVVHDRVVTAGTTERHTNTFQMTKETEDRLRETLQCIQKSEIDGDELTTELAKVLGVDDALLVQPDVEAVGWAQRAVVERASNGPAAYSSRIAGQRRV
jgi:O-phosphoseryl-tRNA(Cys) synthetase